MMEKTNEDKTNIIFFDIETKKLFDEVGGRQNIDKLEVSVAVVYSLNEQKYYVFKEENINDLIDMLFNADLVFGFNIFNFDFKVLQAYTDKKLSEIKFFDLLLEIQEQLGFRVKLDSVASSTLRINKSANGIQAVKWFKQGNFEKLIKYCKDDVKILTDIYRFIQKNGYVCYQDFRTNSIKKVFINL